MASLIPQGRQQYFDDDGNPLAGGFLWAYEAGTTTLKDTYTSAAATQANTNPVVLNARGEATIFFDGSYKLKLTDADAVVIWTQDYVSDGFTGLQAQIDAIEANYVTLADLALSTGAALIGHEGGTVEDALDNIEDDLDFSLLTSATVLADADLMIISQSGTNKSVAVSVLRTDLATEADAAAAAAAASAVDAADAALDAQTFNTGLVYKSTLALLNADLAHAEPKFARVYADATSANNTLYYKLGISGAGSWEVFNDDRLLLLEAEVGALDAKYTAYLGTGYVEPAEVTYGITTPDTTTITAGFTYGNGIPTPSLGVVPQFHIRMSASGTGEIQIYTPDGDGTYTVTDVIPVTVAVGVNALTIATVPLYLPAGTLLHYKQTTGGYPRYIAGGLGSVLNNVTLIENDPVTGTLNQAYTNTFAIAYDFVAVPSETVDNRLLDIEAGTSEQQKDLAAAVGVTGEDVAQTVYGIDTPNTSTITAGFTYGNSYPTAATGYLESFSVRISGAGTGRVIVYEPVAGSALYEVSAIFDVTTAAGVNTYTAFNNIFVPIGSLIHFSRITGGYPRFVAGGAGSKVITGDGALHTVGTQHTAAANTNTMAIAYTLRAAASSLADRIDTLETDVAALSSAPPAPSRALESTIFAGASLPAGWTATGWTCSDGLTAPALGGWDVVALSPETTSLSRRRIFARLIPADTTAVFGICANQSTGGAAALIDGTAGMLRLYSWAGGAVAGTLIEEIALPGALVAGQAYLLDVTVKKPGQTITITATDTLTLLSCSLDTDQVATYAQFHGRAGIMQVSGAAITVDSFDHLALHNPDVRAILIGDSNLEGSSLSAGETSWGNQLAALRTDGDIVVAGRGGDTTAAFIAGRMATDLQSWDSARYVVIAEGTNETVHATWRTNMATIIAAAEAAPISAEVILCTMPPRTAAQALRTLQNTDILTGYFGRYRWIDFAAALSTAQDRITWNPSYDDGDGVHANYAGQQRMLAQVLADAPFLIA